MADILKDLYQIVEQRRAEKAEGSYTAYLFEAGLDKILKKLGEEAAETIIAAKNLASSRSQRNAGDATADKAETAPQAQLAEVVPPGAGSAAAEKAEAAQDAERAALNNEVGDLIYHLTVMLCELGIMPEEIDELLRERMQKTGNLKESRQTDKDS